MFYFLFLRPKLLSKFAVDIQLVGQTYRQKQKCTFSQTNKLTFKDCIITFLTERLVTKQARYFMGGLFQYFHTILSLSLK